MIKLCESHLVPYLGVIIILLLSSFGLVTDGFGIQKRIKNNPNIALFVLIILIILSYSIDEYIESSLLRYVLLSIIGGFVLNESTNL